MSKWTYPKNSPEFGETDLDREFLLDLREVRILLDKEKYLKNIICQKLKPEFLEKTFISMESNFRLISRAIIGVAYSLHHNRNLRGFFVDVLEKIIDPWRILNWSKIDVMHFLKVYISSSFELDAFPNLEVKNAWQRYMDVITTSINQLF